MQIVFLCVANSARSQLAEGLARSMAREHDHIQSAGSTPTQIRPEAIAVMAEIGIDISDQYAKGIDTLNLDNSSLVVTLCAEEACPVLPTGVRTLHWPISDPAGGLEDLENLQGFRDARDQIRNLLTDLFSTPTQIQ